MRAVHSRVVQQQAAAVRISSLACFGAANCRWLSVHSRRPRCHCQAPLALSPPKRTTVPCVTPDIWFGSFLFQSGTSEEVGTDHLQVVTTRLAASRRPQTRRVALPAMSSLRNLDVHHVRRRSALGDDAEANLITLCRDWHQIVHRSEFPRT